MSETGLMNSRVVRLAAYPIGLPTERDFAVTNETIEQPRDGQILCRTLLLSIDPYVRVMVLSPDSHIPGGTHGGIEIGDVMPGRSICQVVASRLNGFEAGDLVVAHSGWQELALLDGTDVRRISRGTEPLEAHLSVLGMPGFTAYAGLRFVGRPNPGETVVVSAASGAVGSVVGQLAHLQGVRTIGIAGANDKCRYVADELHFDACVSHRTDDLEDELRKACPDGIDIYFDNVGGNVLDALLPQLNPGARIVICGRIADLNDAHPPDRVDRRGTFLGYVLTKMLSVQGFVWGQYAEHFDDFVSQMTPLVTSGELRFRTDITEGLENAPAAFRRLFEGANFGKLAVRVAEPS